MASGTRKRQYQPSLTSYFSTLSERCSSGNALSPNAPASKAVQHQTYAPSVPTAVQSSLLNVGMRVRKAVPEGYKTKTSAAAAPATVRTDAPAFHFDPEKENNTSHVTPMSTSERASELLPFCGVHKVGGWGIQDSFATSAPLPTLSPNDTTPFFSSQESNVSSISTDSTPAGLHRLQPRIAIHLRKRQLDEYEDHYGTEETTIDKEYPIFTIFAEEEEEDSAMLMDHRRIARAVTRKKIALPTRHHHHHRNQEQQTTLVHAENAEGSPADFGEAAFLQRPYSDHHLPREGAEDLEMNDEEW